MVCPLKELDTSALSASPRRLTEGVLEGEGPTSADAGVASCLLVIAESVFRRLRDDFCDDKIFDGMIRRGGNELPKRSVGMSLENCGNSVEQAKRDNRTESAARLEWTRLARKGNTRTSKRKKTLSNYHLTYRPSYIYSRRWCLNTL